MSEVEDVLKLVEERSGKQVEIVPDSSLETYATVKMASAFPEQGLCEAI